MRTLDQIVAAIRSDTPYTEEEARYAVVAFDVLLSRLSLDQDVARLQEWMTAAILSPRVYAGQANDPENPEAVAWYRAMHSVTARPPECTCGEAADFIEYPLHVDPVN